MPFSCVYVRFNPDALASEKSSREIKRCRWLLCTLYCVQLFPEFPSKLRRFSLFSAGRERRCLDRY